MQAWEDFLRKQEIDLGMETVKKWLRSLKIIRFDACNLYLEAKDSFQALWFEEHIRPKVLAQLVNNNNKKIRVHVVIGSRPSTNGNSNSLPQKNKLKPAPSFTINFDGIDPLCTFDNFVVHTPNEISTRVLKENVCTFNPIFIFGPPGSGKTHLLMSVARDLMNQGKKVVYARAETFTNHVVSAIRSGEMRRFRDAYRTVDALLLDDVHVLGRKGATQEELFHTFNTLHLNGQNILLSAKCPPGELTDIEPRLVSRFEWGIVLPLEGSQAEHLLSILQAKAKALDYPLTPKLAEFLIQSFPSSPKAVIRGLEALILRSHVEHNYDVHYKSMTVQLAKHYLADLLLAEKQLVLSPEKIIQSCAEEKGIRPEDILGKAQTRDCALPRQVAMYLCRHYLKLPFTRIGDIFGRDHSTVMSSVRLVKKSIDERHEEFTSFITTVQKKIGR